MPFGLVRLGFVGFVDLHDQNYQTERNAFIDNEPVDDDGKIICQIDINMLEKKLLLSLEKCVGEGRDGCSAMPLLQKGAVV